MPSKRSNSNSNLAAAGNANDATKKNTTNTTPMIPMGLDWGTEHARIALWDSNSQRPVLCANHDGHFATKVPTEAEFLAAAAVTAADTEDSEQSSSALTRMSSFYQDQLWKLATSAAHSSNICVTVAIPSSCFPTTATETDTNTTTKNSTETNPVDDAAPKDMRWNVLQETRQQQQQQQASSGSAKTAIISEAAAICLAYPLQDILPSHTAVRILVLDGGASGIKASVMKGTPHHATSMSVSSSSSSSLSSNSWIWELESYQVLESVSGTTLIEPLAQAVALQFEQSCRLPRNEVWMNSKKARRKLLKVCQQEVLPQLTGDSNSNGGSGFNNNNNVVNNVRIHIDGLYEGMDCNVTMSKAKWDHVSNPLARKAQAFLQEHYGSSTATTANNADSNKNAFDAILVAGQMHSWLMPIVQRIWGNKTHNTGAATTTATAIPYATNDWDPSQAVALGCTRHSQQIVEASTTTMTSMTAPAPAPTPVLPTMSVVTSPISIALKDGPTLIAQGMPLPCSISHPLSSSSSASAATSESLQVFQLIQTIPTTKTLVEWSIDETSKNANANDNKKKEEEESKDSNDNGSDESLSLLLEVQLSAQGRLRVSVGGESVYIG